MLNAPARRWQAGIIVSSSVSLFASSKGGVGQPRPGRAPRSPGPSPPEGGRGGGAWKRGAGGGALRASAFPPSPASLRSAALSPLAQGEGHGVRGPIGAKPDASASYSIVKQRELQRPQAWSGLGVGPSLSFPSQ